MLINLLIFIFNVSWYIIAQSSFSNCKSPDYRIVITHELLFVLFSYLKWLRFDLRVVCKPAVHVVDCELFIEQKWCYLHEVLVLESIESNRLVRVVNVSHRQEWHLLTIFEDVEQVTALWLVKVAHYYTSC